MFKKERLSLQCRWVRRRDEGPGVLFTEVKTALCVIAQGREMTSLKEDADFFEMVSKRFCSVADSSSPIL